MGVSGISFSLRDRRDFGVFRISNTQQYDNLYPTSLVSCPPPVLTGLRYQLTNTADFILLRVLIFIYTIFVRELFTALVDFCLIVTLD